MMVSKRNSGLEINCPHEIVAWTFLTLIGDFSTMDGLRDRNALHPISWQAS